MSNPDNTRLRELETLENIVRLAGSLDCGSGICEKIHRLSEECYRVNKDELGMFPRQSIMKYLRALVLADLKRQEEVGKESA